MMFLFPIVVAFFLHASISLVSCLSQDGLYLLQIKPFFSDPDGVLSDWDAGGGGGAPPCNWTGVECDTQDFVVSLSLTSSNLRGPFPSTEHLCRLPHLSTVSLYNNFINGTLPSDLHRCLNLTYLDVSQNLLVGAIPDTLASLPRLLHLDLSGNNFTGGIPPSFAGFRRLEVLSLVSNLLNGTIKSDLANITTLKQLNISYNPFSPSQIPSAFGELSNLEVLWAAECNLVGHIPESIGKLRNLRNLDLSRNNLQGPIPRNLTSLVHLLQIELYGNSLSGALPVGMSKLTSLRRFDASMNGLEGEIPDELCKLPLESLNLYENRLTGKLPEEISQMPNLYQLHLFGNQLTGSLPPNLGRSSPLVSIDVSDNQFSGEIPAHLCDKERLEDMIMINNSLEGEIPDSLARCRSLTRVRLRDNKLSGTVPAGFWALPKLSLIEFSANSLSGQISSAISGAANLSVLLIDNNQFTGELPMQIGSVTTLEEFIAYDNRLSGSIPRTFTDLARLSILDLHNNEISGELPGNIRAWRKLSELNLAHNQISGIIPPELGSLPVLNYLDLSNNCLVGQIPPQLQNLKLNFLNISDNDLSGKLPTVFSNEVYHGSFLSNPRLCVNRTGFCSNADEDSGRPWGYGWLLGSCFTLAGLTFLIGVGWFCWTYHEYRKGKFGGNNSKWKLTSFHKLAFSESEILDCLDEDNLIGSGASGKVYKVVIGNGDAVAVKKLWETSKTTEADEKDPWRKAMDDYFMTEVETLGKVRHKNIVKLWCCCTIRDCKLLVYEFMPNGSLGNLLHSPKEDRLDWPTRYKIALGAAEGLAYLHHDCNPPVVHRDVKANNILLDDEYEARLADFGLAKMMEDMGQGPNSMSVVAGSCGYIAPEYAYTLRVNEKSDVYSFGVVILELVTGKLPVAPEFGESDLVKWVRRTLEQKGADHVFDPYIDPCYRGQIRSVVDIGLLCTSALPINRPTMRRVVKMFLEVGSGNRHGHGKKEHGTLTP